MARVCSFSSLGSKYIHSNSINFVAVIVDSFVGATLVLSVGRLGVGTSDLNGDFTTISSVWKQKLIIEHISRYK